MKTVLINILGIELDSSVEQCKWTKWRPSIAVCQHREISIDKYHLLYQGGHERLAEEIKQDINSLNPKIEVILDKIEYNNPWDFENVYETLYQYTQNFKFDTDKEEYFVGIKTGTHVARICLFLLTESRHFPAKLVQISKPDKDTINPIGYCSIIDLDLSKYDSIAKRFQIKTKDDLSFLKSGIETRNKQFNRQIELIEKVAIRSTHPMLLMGPTGAGKSFLAKRIFQLKKLQHKLNGNFVELNCATLKGSAAMSTLFGHKKGAYTGALQDRNGLLKEANDGILFLDEIGELGLDEQAMLLRAMEEKSYYPLGSDVEIKSDFQLICGTNRDLNEATLTGEFREDLLSRINLWTFTLPGLKERPEDIEPNLDFEINRFAEVNGYRISFNKEAKCYYLKFATSNDALWTANFRDLNSSVTRMGTLAPSGRIDLDTVKSEIEVLKNHWKPNSRATGDIGNLLIEYLTPEQIQNLDPFDKVQLNFVINVCKDSKSLADAGKKLFVSSRLLHKTQNDSDRLRKYLVKFKLSWYDISL